MVLKVFCGVFGSILSTALACRVASLSCKLLGKVVGKRTCKTLCASPTLVRILFHLYLRNNVSLKKKISGESSCLFLRNKNEINQKSVFAYFLVTAFSMYKISSVPPWR